MQRVDPIYGVRKKSRKDHSMHLTRIPMNLDGTDISKMTRGYCEYDASLRPLAIQTAVFFIVQNCVQGYVKFPSMML